MIYKVLKSFGVINSPNSKFLPKLSPSDAKIKAVILDFSGTIVDKHSFSPVLSFIKAFELEGVEISEDEARVPMGKRKDIHV